MFNLDMLCNEGVLLRNSYAWCTLPASPVWLLGLCYWNMIQQYTIPGKWCVNGKVYVSYGVI